MTADADRKRSHWRRTRLLAALILAAWSVAAAATPLFVNDLDRIEFLGFPLGYFMITTGVPLFFLLLLLAFNGRQNAIDGNSGERN